MIHDKAYTRLALVGENAGGNLALATTIAARDGGVQSPLHVLAVYPVGQTGNLETNSYQDSATDFVADSCRLSNGT